MSAQPRRVPVVTAEIWPIVPGGASGCLSFPFVQLPERLTRRRLLGLAALGVGGAAWPVEDAAAGPRAVSSGAVTCVLAPELTEGPYYVPNEAVRRDITEGKPGTPPCVWWTRQIADSRPDS